MLSGVIAQTITGYSIENSEEPPFHHETGNLQEVLHWVPAGAEVTRFDSIMMKLRKATCQRQWSDPGAQLKRGEGFLFLNPTDSIFPLVMSGTVPPGRQRLALQGGTSLRASMLPIAGDILQDLHVPFQADETLTLFYADRQEYAEFKRTEHGWSEPPPKIRVGEGFWIGKKSAADWEQMPPAALADED